jgi:hypothetical protein
LFEYLFIVWGIAICILFIISRRLIYHYINNTPRDPR